MVDVLAKEGNVEEVEGLSLGTALSALIGSLPKAHLLPQQGEVRLMGHETKHDLYGGREEGEGREREGEGGRGEGEGRERGERGRERGGSGRERGGRGEEGWEGEGVRGMEGGRKGKRQGEGSGGEREGEGSGGGTEGKGCVVCA